MDLLNEIYTILGIIASAIAIGTAIFAAVRIGKKLYISSKQKKSSPIYVPDPIKKQNKPKIGRTWITYVIITLSIIIIGFPLISSLLYRAKQNFISPILTDCPPSGVARPATLKQLSLHSNQTIIYSVNEGTHTNSPSAILNRYDVGLGSTSKIVKLADTLITEAEVSRDGQWILFVSKVAGSYRIEIVRVDGHYLQTLYCASSSESIRGQHIETCSLYAKVSQGRNRRSICTLKIGHEDSPTGEYIVPLPTFEILY